jgi:glucose-6-phosphate dehydrogenase assembly protein OpcA
MTVPATPLGAPVAIDIRMIERELNELWRQATEAHGNGSRAVTRVCVLNLVVCVADRRAADHATEVVAQLMGRYPNRAIVINAADGDATDTTPLLDAWVQAHCQMPGPGRPQVCCEQITIEAQGTGVERVPGAVLPLLVPDVPAMLWWPHGAPFDHPLFARLHAIVDRVIVDSSTFAAPEAGFAQLVDLLDGKQALSDLAWGRLTPWRELVAQFFDAPAMLPHLNEVERVTIVYEARSDGATGRNQAVLLAGWLASRLGWSPEGAPQATNDSVTFTMRRRDGAPLSVDMRPAPATDDLMLRLASIKISGAHARFAVRRGDASDCAEASAEVAGKAPLRRVVRLERLDEATLIGEELRLLRRDKGFEGALRVAAELVG